MFLDMMGLGANFIMREVASSANSYANFHYDIYQDTFSTSDTQLGFQLGLPESVVSSWNLVFSCDSWKEVFHVSEEREDQKGKGWADTPFRTRLGSDVWCIFLFLNSGSVPT